jgi:hypothetical protein
MAAAHTTAPAAFLFSARDAFPHVYRRAQKDVGVGVHVNAYVFFVSFSRIFFMLVFLLPAKGSYPRCWAILQFPN